MDETCCSPVVKWCVWVGLPRQVWSQPVSVGENIVRDTDRDGVVVLPRIVADQSNKDVHNQQNTQNPAAGWQGNSLKTWMFREKWHGWGNVDEYRLA